MAYLARRVSEYSVKQIADHFRRSSVTVSEAIRKVEDLLQKDKALVVFSKYPSPANGALDSLRKNRFLFNFVLKCV